MPVSNLYPYLSCSAVQCKWRVWVLLVVFYNSPGDSLEGAAMSPGDPAKILEPIGSKAT